MAKRGHGTGSVVQLSDGRWQARASYWDGDKLRRKAVYGKTRREAEQKLRALLAALDRGERPPDGRLTVGESLARWFEVHRERLRPSTARRYRQLIVHQLMPAFARQRLAQLTAADVEHAMRRLASSGLAARTVLQARAVLRRALQDAVRDGLVPRNVAALARPPAAPRPTTVVWTSEEARAFWDVAEQHWLGALYQFILLTGLRLGEAVGFTWADVDLDAGTLRITAQLQFHDGRFVRLPPKSAASRRVLPLPPLARDLLRRQRERQQAWRQSGEWIGNEWGLVFTTQRGTPLHARNVHRTFVRLVEQAGVRRIRVHDLRHTAATLLLEAGVSLKVVSMVLGHSQLSITADYYLVVRERLACEALARLDALLGDAN